MKIRVVDLALIVMLLFGLGKTAWASGFVLTHIGNLSTSGRQINHWWYTGLNPTLRGEAVAGSQVDIGINSETYQVAADESGQWSFTSPVELGAGDHVVSLSNSGSTINFTLTLGAESVNWQAIEAGGSDESLPAAGVMLPTLLLSGLGGGLLLTGKKLWR